MAATGVVVPLTFHSQSASAPATGRGGYTVTVEPPGPHAREGLIATGTVNGKSWQYTVGAPIKQGPDRGEQVVTAAGPAFVPVQRMTTTIPFPGAGIPTAALFSPQWGEQTAGMYGTVRSGVDHLTVRLTNGTALTLHPVAAFGLRLVAFAVPTGAVIVRVIGGRKFFAVGTSFSTKSNTLHWGAYDATGQKVASGEFTY